MQQPHFCAASCRHHCSHPVSLRIVDQGRNCASFIVAGQQPSGGSPRSCLASRLVADGESRCFLAFRDAWSRRSARRAATRGDWKSSGRLIWLTSCSSPPLGDPSSGGSLGDPRDHGCRRHPVQGSRPVVRPPFPVLLPGLLRHPDAGCGRGRGLL